MKIVIDDKIPYIQGVFEPVGEVVYLSGSKTTADVVKDADVLITRTRTRCNRELLEGSAVKFIATATIGYDHIDVDYCQSKGIAWTNAPGCNAGSVNQYIASALCSWSLRTGTPLKGKTIGVVGVGHVGSKVARTCKILGMRVLLNDPPRERAEGTDWFVSLETIQKEADIITLHVPLNKEGADATFHMADDLFFQNLEKKPLLINSCRGEVVETEAVKRAMDEGRIGGFIADCWENEPDIDLKLLDSAMIGTPHIAGYSKDGKANGTMMSVQAISRFFHLGLDAWKPEHVELPESVRIEIDGAGRSEEEILIEAVRATYTIEQDDLALRSAPQDFENLRGNYPVRREFGTYTVYAVNVTEETMSRLRMLGFEMESK